MSRTESARAGWGRLELLLGMGILALLWQLFPQQAQAIFFDVLHFVDARDWSRSGWIIANAVGIGILVAVRYGPDVRRWAATNREHRIQKKMELQDAKEQDEETQKLAAQRELFNRLKQGRKRRVY